jgi:NADH-quinone oxidoreductase subunit C
MGKTPKPPTPPPTPEEPPSARSWGEPLDSLLASIAELFSDSERRDSLLYGEPAILISPGRALEFAFFLRDNDICGFNYCRSVTGTDKIVGFDVTYNLARLPKPGGSADSGFASIAIVVQISDRKDPRTQSLIHVWPGVDFQEREIFDLLGIQFDEHPDLRRILLDDAFEGYPLRKDYPLIGKWEDMLALNAFLDENQVRTMKEDAGLNFKPEDVPPSFKR